MTKIKMLQVIIASALAIFGLEPFWCDSCGEPYLTDDMVVCSTCGAHICTGCSDAWETEHGAGCFVCEGDETVDGHDESEDPVAIPELFYFYD